jgi:hypothetical protein
MGGALGNLPMLVFDARHDFYHIRTFFLFFVDTIHGTSGGNITYYQFLNFWPLFMLILGYLLFLLYKKNKIVSIFLLLVYLVLNIRSPIISFTKAVGMPDGIVAKDIDTASQKIATDSQGDFNVAEVLDFDKRAYVLRYFVQYKYGKKTLSEISYQNLGLLYVLAQKDYNFAKSDVWEINAGGPYKINIITDVGTGYAIYKLTK